MMTEEHLAQIEARIAQATPGPWWAEPPRTTGTGWVHYGPSRPAHWATVICNTFGHPGNAEFIASAREDMPALVAEVCRLKAQVAELSAALGAAIHDG